MKVRLRVLAVVLAASLLSGCTNPAGGFDPGAAVNLFLDVTRTVANFQDLSDTGTGQIRIFQSRSLLDKLETSIAKLRESTVKEDLKNASAALRSALNGSAYLLDSIREMKANRTHETQVDLYAAWGSFTDAQRLAANVSDPEMRRALDFGPLKAQIETMAAGTTSGK